MKVYDCFTFYNEVEVLELRLNILKDVVDFFVIVESTFTHQRKPKELVFPQVRERFVAFADKIIYIVADNPPPDEGERDQNGNDWLIENWQKHEINRGLVNCEDEDVILFSDLDEIARPELVKKYLPSQGIVTLKCDNYAFYLNYRSFFSPFGHAQILSYKTYRTQVAAIPRERLIAPRNLVQRYHYAMSLAKVRTVRGDVIVPHGGWHFSYVGGLDRVILKMDSIVEQSITNAGKKGKDWLRQRIQNGLDIYNDGTVYMPTTRGLPKYILAHQAEYQHLFWHGSIMQRLRLKFRFRLMQFFWWMWLIVRRLFPKGGERCLRSFADKLKSKIVKR